MNTNNFTCDAFILAYKREENLPAVLEGIRRQSFVKDIYVVHNWPSVKRVDGVINIFSEKNFGCIGRHAIAQLAEAPYVLFVDDDLELKTDFSSRFIAAAKSEPGALIGMFGCDIDPAVPPEKLYASGGEYSPSLFQRYVDVVKGRVHMCRKEHLLNSFQFIFAHRGKIDGLRKDDFIMDDLILNLSTQLKTQTPGILIPVDIGKGEYVNLKEDYGASFMPDHHLLRSHLVRKFLELGWQPLAGCGRFLKKNIVNGGTLFKDEGLIRDIRKCLEKADITGADNAFLQLNDKTRLPRILRYQLAGLYREKPDYSKAEQIYLELLEGQTQSPGDNELKALSAFHLGVIDLNRDNTRNAARYFRQCIELMPQHRLASQYLQKLGA